MEFRRSVFNPINFNYQQNGHSSTNLSFFAEQARRVGYPRPDPAQARDYFRHPSDVRSDPVQAIVRHPSDVRPDPVQAVDYFRHPSDLPESVLLEIEKQRIREDLIASEVERRRRLEAEVRMEMMMEREMAMRGALSHDYPGFPRPQPLLMNSRLPVLEPLDRRFNNELPFSRPSEVRITEVETSAEVKSEVKRDRIILLPKPQGSIGIKRKAGVSPDTSSVMPLVVPKKAKDPLACEICNISATSQRALSEHFQGKKHKSREARQSSQIAGKNFAIGLFSRKSNTPDITKEDVHEEKPEDDVAIQVSENSKKLKNDEVEMNKKAEKDSLKFSHWCEMCKIGTFSRKVMNAHMRGKKHTSRVLESRNSRAGVTSRIVPDTAAAEEVTQAQQDIAGGSKDEEEMEKDVVVGSGSNQAEAPLLLLGWIDNV